MFKETRTRSIMKTVLWRVIAIFNSYLVLVFMVSDEPMYNALLMNLTGFIIYYFYERFWGNISKGKFIT
jgi:uncharacterized membrane protein